MKAYKYKLRPNKSFIAECERTLNACRELYNASIQERRDAWQINHVSVGFYSQCLQLPAIKSDRPDLKEIHSQVLQDVLRRSQKTFDGFFRRVKLAKELRAKGINAPKPGYPRFKGKNRYDSFTYPQKGFQIDGDKLYLSKIGSCRIRLSRPIQGVIKTCTIKREADGWYVVFSVEENQNRFIPRTGDSVGIDVGIESFATLSTGEQIDNPQPLRASERQLKTAQRRVNRRPNKRSNRRRKAVKILARKYQKVSRQRADFHHKTALQVVREFDDIAIEDLNIAGMVRNHHLAKSISDAGWGNFASILETKAESAGRRVVRVPAQFTSQDCSGCGQRVKKSLATRQHVCGCGINLHRDHNAAINIQKRGAHASGMVSVGRS